MYLFKHRNAIVGINKTNTFRLKFFSSMKIVAVRFGRLVGVRVLGGLWALEWGWHIRVTNLRPCKATESKSEIPNSLSLIDPILYL